MKVQDPANVRRTWNVDVKIGFSFLKSCSEGSGSQGTCMQNLKGFLSVYFELLVNRKIITQMEELFPLQLFGCGKREQYSLRLFVFLKSISVSII